MTLNSPIVHKRAVAVDDFSGIPHKVRDALPAMVVIAPKLQVFRSVICFISVAMVNAFMLVKWSPKNVRHDLSVFQNETARRGVGVPMAGYLPIASTKNRAVTVVSTSSRFSVPINAESLVMLITQAKPLDNRGASLYGADFLWLKFSSLSSHRIAVFGKSTVVSLAKSLAVHFSAFTSCGLTAVRSCLSNRRTANRGAVLRKSPPMSVTDTPSLRLFLASLNRAELHIHAPFSFHYNILRVGIANDQ